LKMNYRLKKISGDASFREFYRLKKIIKHRLSYLLKKRNIKTSLFTALLTKF